jgi:cobalt-zinc-cadmium resistance protein CzcA
VQRPLAVVVLGGLVSATLMTLLLLPAFYLWLERRESSARADQIVVNELTAAAAQTRDAAFLQRPAKRRRR